jgi:hypothetical protein
MAEQQHTTGYTTTKGEAMKNPEFMTTTEAAEFLGCKRWALRNWMLAGKLPGFKSIAVKENLYRRSDIEALAVPQQIQHTQYTSMPEVIFILALWTWRNIISASPVMLFTL